MSVKRARTSWKRAALFFFFSVRLAGRRLTVPETGKKKKRSSSYTIKVREATRFVQGCKHTFFRASRFFFPLFLFLALKELSYQ